jgi:VanZ family protein
MLKIVKYHWRAIAWVALIVVACMMPLHDDDDSKPSFLYSIPYLGKALKFLAEVFEKIPHFDKIVHFVLYFIFVLFLMSGFSRQYGKTTLKITLQCLFIALALGALIEILQPLVERNSSLFDMCANALGIVMALILFKPIKWTLRNIL